MVNLLHNDPNPVTLTAQGWRGYRPQTDLKLDSPAPPRAHGTGGKTDW